MKKEWNTPCMEELSINLTANGETPNQPFDGPWTEIAPNQWWAPGSSR
jgi:hypothetical protein